MKYRIDNSTNLSFSMGNGLLSKFSQQVSFEFHHLIGFQNIKTPNIDHYVFSKLFKDIQNSKPDNERKKKQKRFLDKWF